MVTVVVEVIVMIAVDINPLVKIIAIVEEDVGQIADLVTKDHSFEASKLYKNFYLLLINSFSIQSSFKSLLKYDSI